MTSLKRLKLLVVDDNAHTLAAVVDLLRSLGVASIETAENGMAAAARLAQQRFDILLTDWYMPDMNGASLVKVVRDDRFETNRGIPVVVMTGYASSENLSQAKALGVDDILLKPLKDDNLREVLQRLAEAVPARFGEDEDGDYFAI